MSGIAGLRGTGDFGTDERPKDFRESILWFNPNGDAPIFALSSKAKKKKTTDPEFAWWHEGMTVVRLQVNGALASGDTLVTVDSADPTTSTLDANYGTATHLKPGDLLLAEPTTDNATYNQEILMVENVLSDTQFTVRRGAAGTSAASIADDRYLTLIGSAYAEGTPAPRATSRNPLKFYNYTQIFKDTYELSGTVDKTNVRTGDSWSNDKKRKAFKHSADIEMALLWGRRSETTGTNGKPLRTTGGLRTFIPASNTTVFGAAVTSSTFAAALEPAFRFGDTGAGNTRVMFVGSGAALELSKVFSAVSNIHVEAAEYVKIYGLNFRRFVLPMGEILLRIHPLMSRNTILNKAGFLVDFDALAWRYLEGRDTKAKDDVQADDEDVRRGFWQTEGGFEVGYGGLTMAYLGNISAT